MSALTALVCILATWRISTMIVGPEEGPFEIFATLRDSVDPFQKTWLGRGIRCIMCVSFWIGGVIALCVGALGYIPFAEVVLWQLAFSAGAIILDAAYERTSAR